MLSFFRVGPLSRACGSRWLGAGVQLARRCSLTRVIALQLSTRSHQRLNFYRRELREGFCRGEQILYRVARTGFEPAAYICPGFPSSGRCDS